KKIIFICIIVLIIKNSTKFAETFLVLGEHGYIAHVKN
ncbi:hypothetical protein EVA_12056, partial [gut metagenome]